MADRRIGTIIVIMTGSPVVRIADMTCSRHLTLARYATQHLQKTRQLCYRLRIIIRSSTWLCSLGAILKNGLKNINAPTAKRCLNLLMVHISRPTMAGRSRAMGEVPSWLLDGDEEYEVERLSLSSSTGDTSTSEDIKAAYQEYKLAAKHRYTGNYRNTNLEKRKRQERRASKKYRRSNPNKIRARGARYRTSGRNGSGEVIAEDIHNQYKFQKGLCWWCSKSVGDEYHVDHVIPLSRGGKNTPENIVISCPPCNHQKNNKLPHEWNGRLF